MTEPRNDRYDSMDEQHRETMARPYDPAADIPVDSYARLTERVIEDERRAQINQAVQRRGR